MNLTSHLLQRMLRLPPPLTRDLIVERDLRVPMRDGMELLADRWVPRTGGDSLPTALIRTPYGRQGVVAAQLVRPVVERDFQVVIQISCARVRLWPTAYRFRRGHRIRVQVSSGAFPRYNRSPGTGEPRATAVSLRAAHQKVFHDPAHRSAVILPVKEAL